jgi:hypothetical protein
MFILTLMTWSPDYTMSMSMSGRDARGPPTMSMSGRDDKGCSVADHAVRSTDWSV